MIAHIKPSHIAGKVTVPPSKSMAHRALISSSLAAGTSIIRNISLSGDISATVSCLRALGAGITLTGTTAEVVGFDPFAGGGRITLDARESGSTLRFLIPLCLLSGRECEITGSPRLLERPLDDYKNICRKYGFRFDVGSKSVTVSGRLRPDRYEVSGESSSQFASGLMFALPLLDGDSEIVMTGKVESKPYIKMTSAVLAGFGIKAEYDGDARVVIPGKQRYKTADFTVEGDASAAAFFDAFNLLGGDVTTVGVNGQTAQGDIIYREYFRRIGDGAPLPLDDCPDLAPVMFALAAERGGCAFTGTRRLAFKESDRATAMAEELSKFGAELVINDDSVIVRGGSLHAPTVVLSSHNDHRVAMALSVLLTKYGGTIDGCEAANKSMPDFFDRIVKLGGDVTVEQKSARAASKECVD